MPLPRPPGFLTSLLLLSAGALSAQSPAPTAPDRCAYLGVATRPLNSTLRTQLGLPEGIGLVVLYSAPKSPASKKLLNHDVLHMFEDQLLVSQHQLATLINLYKPEETVQLSLIRQGQPMTVDVTLSEITKKSAHTIAPALFKDSFSSSFDISSSQTDAGDTTSTTRRSTRTLITDDHYVTLVVRDGNKTLNARDREGNVLFKGDINTEKERDAVPTDILPILKKLEAKRSSPKKIFQSAIP